MPAVYLDKPEWFTMAYRPSSAGMVESADTADLKSADHKMVVGVQVPLPAPPHPVPFTFHLFNDWNMAHDYR